MSTRTQHEASSSSKRWMHDVFLSFRGDDTRNGFTGHLYMTLKEAGVDAFIDNQLRRGEEITTELVQAIRGSRISVIIFSKRYADSSWCLQELVEIMDCRRRLGQIVLPVFYDVDPSHVRKQTSGSFAQAFQKHEESFHQDTDKVARWRAALTEASNLSGWDLKNTANGNEAELIRKIIGEITKHLDSKYLSVAVYQVGIDSRVKEINSLDGGSYGVQMVGIWGMGGMGKTSVAKAIYNKFYHSFEYKSFLANVRETAKEPNGMMNLQEKLLSDIFKPTKVEVGDVHRGINVIKEKLRSRAVLVIIDDVDHVDQLNALAVARDSFGRGSKIFITTRDRHLLEQVEVNIIYLARKMKEEEALELFSWHAFRNRCPNEEYVELTRSVLGYCGGLPLALEVLGSFLFKRSIRDWTSTLKKLENIPRFEIQEKLKIGFDALSDEDEREIFLDISCFFIGMDKNYVTRILDGCGFFAEIGISVLLQRCLVTVDEKNKLVMHDLLRDMGREIVRAKFPNHPGKCSRLWRQEDAIGVLTDKSGTEDIEGLALNLLRSDKASFSMKAFRKMKRLRLLQLNCVHLTGDYKHLSAKLRWLCWRGFPLKFIPKEALNQLRSLVSIDLRYSNLIQFWEHSMLLEKLKILNLSHSYFLKQSPNFSKLPNLEYLILKGCKNLLEIHHSIGCLERLALVNLKDCIMLKDLPKSFYKLKRVETLVLSGCSRFQNLVADIGEMVSLTTLLTDNTAIEELPYSSIARLKNLTRLSLCGLKLIEPNPSVWPLVLTREYPPELHCSISFEDFRTINMFSNRFYILPRNHKRKTTSGDGVIFPPGNDIAKWFTNVDNEGDRVCFQVPQTTGSNLKSLTVCTVYSSSLHKDAPLNHFAIFITNHTKIISFVVRPMDPYTITSNEVIWQGHLSNKELSLERGDSIEVYIVMGSGFRVKKTGVHLVWDPELINENVIEFESIPYAYFRSDVEYEAGPSHAS
ncbi:hypothetical protein C1H46_040668 [Malus baccata]|uniref:TIR domain-containing protein n=1 Tax=Malus baccata TaxID=106549 RepID=A0A540KHU3_MALBA|nr:hypothetical protein C1H46_040668 [Malus baccata]